MQRFYAILAVVVVVALAAVAAVSVRTHAQSENLIAQKDCSVQAEKFYRTGGVDEPTPGVIFSYVNHYNIDQGKCFIVIMSLDSSDVKDGGRAVELHDLFDAFEGREYGVYVQSFAKGEGLRVVKCTVTVDGKDRTCSSFDQWQALAAHYME